MDIRISRVLLVIAIIAIAWISKSNWLPEINQATEEAFTEKPVSKPQTLEQYSS